MYKKTIYIHTFLLLCSLLSAPVAAAADIAKMAGLSTFIYKAFTSYRRYQEFKEEIKPWDWKEIGTDDGRTPSPDFKLKPEDFPQNFLCGAGNAAIQSEGGLPEQDGITNSTYNDPRYRDRYPELQGHANNTWQDWDKDLQISKKLEVNSERLSIEWSRIEKTPGNFDYKALDEYARRCAELTRNGIKPIIGFHHYSDPHWFMHPNDQDQPVGFEDLHNAHHFVTYCAMAFTRINAACQEVLQEFSPEIQKLLAPIWLLANSPVSYAINGYQRGERPPREKDMQRAVNVAENFLRTCEAAAYQIKTIQPDAHVSLSHNIMPLDPAFDENKPWLQAHVDWLKGAVGSYFGNWLSNSAGLRFLTDGAFTILIPGKATKNMRPDKLLKSFYNRYTRNPKGHPFDSICLNYYTHNIMEGMREPVPSPTELKTGNPRNTIYAEGLYRALKEIKGILGDMPIYVIENGFAQNNIVDHDGTLADGEERRMLFLNRHLYAIKQAVADGIDVRGYIYWAKRKNVEWSDGFKKDYGLADEEGNIKPSGEYYRQLTAPIKGNFREMMSQQRRPVRLVDSTGAIEEKSE